MRRALLHWKAKLQSLAWRGFRAYHATRRAKRAAAGRAAELYHREALREACARMLRAADELRARRVGRAIATREEATRSVWETVARCARHWPPLS